LAAIIVIALLALVAYVVYLFTMLAIAVLLFVLVVLGIALALIAHGGGAGAIVGILILFAGTILLFNTMGESDVGVTPVDKKTRTEINPFDRSSW